MTSPALLLQQVSFHYGKTQVLSDVSLSIEPGETVILLGPNGAGKSTLFSLICGLFATQSGSIRVHGKSPVQQPEALAPLGIVFQSQTLDMDLTVEQNLRYFCSLQGIAPRHVKERIDQALLHLELDHRRHDRVRTLNGGHRRRVEIARATLHKPKILLLDEPTVGLDIPTRQALIDDIHALPESQGCAILWATHLIDEVQPDDRIVVLHKGRICHDDQAANLLASTGTADLSELLHQVMGKSTTGHR